MGRLADTFPLDWGWRWGDSDECHHLSELTIKRLTKEFTHLLTKGTKRASAPPNAETVWEQRLAGKLAFPIPWKEIWKSKGTFLTTPKDENTWWKLLHRALHTRSRDSTLTIQSCRLCGSDKETMLHLLTCLRVRKVQDALAPLLQAVGVSATDTYATWLFGLCPRGKLLREAPRALIRIFWRVVYRHMVRKEIDRVQFVTELVVKDIAHTFMTRILHTQMERQRFNLKRVEAQNKDRPNDYITHLPRSLAERYSDIGVLDLPTGYLEIHDGVIDFLKAQGVWSDFNSPGRAGGTQ